MEQQSNEPKRGMPEEDREYRRDAGAQPGKTPGQAEGPDESSEPRREEPGKTPGRAEGEPSGPSQAV